MSSTCGCCAPSAPLTPVTISNRPGLSAIAYRVGTYASFRETMLDAIAGTPELANLTTRQSDDYSITFIDLWAALLDVITFYQERYANEVYLRPAQQLASLRRLARLLDYSPRPGVAAIADLAFILDPSSVVQIPIGLRVQSVPAQNQQPQIYETLESIAADARLNRLRIYPQPQGLNPLAQSSQGAILDRMSGPSFLSTLSPNDPVVLFNDGGSDLPEEKKVAALTIQDDQVRLTWTKPVQGANWTKDTDAFKYRRTFRMFGYNASPTFMQPSASDDVPGGFLWTQVSTDFTNPGGTTLNLDSRYSDLATGTQLLVVMLTPPPSSGTFSAGVFEKAAVQSPVELLKLAKAPAKVSIGGDTVITGLSFGNLLGVNFGDILGTIIGLGGGIGIEQGPSLQTNLVTVTAVNQVSATTPVAPGPGSPAGSPTPPQSPAAMNDTVTQVTIEPALAAISDIRSVMIFELVGPQILFWGNDYAPSLGSSTVYIPGKIVQAGQNMAIEAGRTIQQNAFVPGVVISPLDFGIGRKMILTDGQGEPLEATVQGPPTIDPVDGSVGSFGHLIVPLQADSVSLQSASAVMLGNVALASNGQTVSNEVLGSGDASQEFQSFTLQKQPLTYVPGSGPGGVLSSLKLMVNKLQWQEVPELYSQAPTAQVFSTRTGDDGKTVIQGGDGTFGALFPSGQANITAIYRVGSGVGGDVAANSLTTLLDRLPGLNSVNNPLAAEGGADPETIDAIRQNAPRTVRTFNRAVSLQDFQDLITDSGEVAKALATWVWDGYAPAVHLTVAGQQGGTFSDMSSLAATIANERDANHRLLIDNYVRVPIVLSAKLWVDSRYSQPDVLTAAMQAVLNALSFDQLELGESIHLSWIYSVLQGVTGIVGSDVTIFGFNTTGITNVQAYLSSRGVTLLPNGQVGPVQDFLRIFAARPNPDQPGQVLPAEIAWVQTPAQDIILSAQGA